MSAGWKNSCLTKMSRSGEQSKHTWGWWQWPCWPAQQQSNLSFCSGETSGAGEPEITSTAGDNRYLHKDIKKIFRKLSPSLSLTHSLPPLQFSSNIPASLSFLKTSYSGLWGQKKLVLNCGYLGGGGWWRVSVVLHSATTTITGKNTCEEWAEPVWQR